MIQVRPVHLYVLFPFRPLLRYAMLIICMTLPYMTAAQVSVGDRLADSAPSVVIAHRSAEMGGEPENSLPWIEMGLQRGVDGMHINIQQTADGQYILMHDATLNRTTNVEAVFPDGLPDGPTRAQRAGLDYVRDYTLAQIRQLRIVANGSSTPLAVPTLDEALALVDGRALVSIGLKTYDIESLARVLNAQVHDNLLLFELYFPGTTQDKLRDLALASGRPVAVVLYQSREPLADLDAIHGQLGPILRVVHVRSTALSADFKQRIDDLGLHLVVSGWGAIEDTALIEHSSPGPWLEILDRGYSAMTAYPDAVLDLLAR